MTQLVKGEKLHCPKCHHVTAVPPPKGVNGLVKNYGVLEIMYSHPTLFKHQKESSSNQISQSTPSSSVLSKNQSNDVPLCPDHEDRLSSYCEEDKVLVCSSCLLYGAHKNHQSKLASDVAHDWKQTLVKLTPDIKEMINVAEKSIEDIELVKESVSASSHQLSDQIDGHFNELINVIEKKRKELKVEVLHRSQSRIEALMEQRE